MKKTLAIILSVLMLIGVMPFAAFAAEPAYDRGKVAANDEAYIDSMDAEQIASVILDWVDREIAKYSADIKEDITAGVIANGGFEEFEAILGEDALGNIIAEQIPEITSLDGVIAYKDYLKELGGDFVALDASALITRAEAGSALCFIDGVFEFMAANSEIFGKVFRWDDEVFDYGKVGEYILSLDPTVEENKAIIDFYNDYLIGNNIQAKFTKWVADQMNYTIPDGETFDDTLNNGILGWFTGLCKQYGILSEEAIAELETYDLRTTDIYTLVKNFVALAEEDNEVKLDTYYNYLLDTVVRSLLKTALGQKAVVGADAALPASFSATYTDLALLEEISGGQLYYQDGADYYQITIADGAATAKALTWETVVDFEFPTATIYTGANFDKEVQVYYPTSADAVQVLTYATAKNQALIGDALTFNGTEVPAEFAALMTDKNAKTLEDGFGLTVKQGDNVISELNLTFKEIEEYAEAQAFPIAQKVLEDTIASMQSSFPMAIDVKLDAIDVVLSYNGWATEDEFICQVKVDSVKATLSGAMASMVQSIVDSAATSAIGTTIDNPVATVVVDGISGGKGIDASGAKELLEFLDTDFVIDQGLLDFTANYDAYNGVVGQANRVLYDLVDMLVSDAGMQKLALEEGMNDKFTANLEKICATANDMMVSAEAIMTDPEVEALLGQAGIDMSALLGSFDLDLLYAIDFSNVEALWVSVITLGLDLIDDGSNELIKEIHALVGDLTNLDAMAVAMADYVLDKCITDLNKALADAGVDFALTVPAATDAKTVADGAGKDIIMTKLVDLAYEAATDGVALVNSIANEALATIATETGIEMPTVAFALNVEKGATWEATLTALVNRVYELADGIIITCAEKPADTIDAISKVANAILPLGSLASNCAANGYAFDINTVMGFIFDDGLEGDFDGFLRLFETKEKTEDVAADVSVTEALIMASEHIVDAFFPDTVKSEIYVNLADYNAVSFTETTVQEYFTGAENDAVIASNNMDSINARKADLVPAVLNLAREAGILPFFAACDNSHVVENLVLKSERVDSTCKSVGHEAIYECTDCGYTVGGAEIAKKAHSWGAWKQTTAPTCEGKGVDTRICGACGTSATRDVAATGHVTWSAWSQTVAPSCEAKGVEARTCSCGKTETREIAATGHPDADGNKICDACGHDWNEYEEEDNSFFGKIKAFFQKIIDWFKNLFK